jgi:tripartite-type tricarboxylate transporter receptor subunit TctC
MKKMMALAAMAMTATAAPAQITGAAFHPARPVTIIVPYSAGGGTDAVARIFAKHLGVLWKQPVIVDNRPGASGVIGSSVVAKAAPDGVTLLLAVSSIAINPHVMTKMPYDTEKDFTPITQLAKPVVVMVGAPNLKATDIKSFLDLARREPGVHSYASSEYSTRLYGERLSEEASVKLLHVPYKGAGQWMTDVMGNNVDTGFASITSALPAMKEGRIKILGVAALQRSEMLPNVPTFKEQGVNGLESQSWYGLFAPGHTPSSVTTAIHADVVKVLAMPETKATLTTLGAEPGGESPEVFAKRFTADVAEYGKLIRKLGIKPE